MFNNFLPISVQFMRYAEKCGTVIQATDDDTIRRMRFASWMNNAIDANSEYVTILSVALQTMYMRKRYYVEFLRKLAVFLCLLLPKSEMVQATQRYFKINSL